MTIDYDLQKAAEDGFRHAGFQRRGAHHGSAQRRGATYVSLPAYDPTNRVRHRSRDVGVSQHRQAAAAAEPRDPGTGTTRSRSRSSCRGRLEEGVIDDTSGHRSAAHISSAATSSAPEGGHGSVESGTRWEVVHRFFYTVGNMLGVDKIYKWLTSWG